ncbi:hypothetical protein ACE1SV_01230 [Streptomyces sp. E-15]
MARYRREHDDAGRRIGRPLQVPRAARDDPAGLYGRGWAGDRLDGGPVDSGHHIAEEAPEALVTALRAYRRRKNCRRSVSGPPAGPGRCRRRRVHRRRRTAG